jgi:hypothetical protein
MKITQHGFDIYQKLILFPTNDQIFVGDVISGDIIGHFQGHPLSNEVSYLAGNPA